ncbi:MAG: CbtB-domain containing protein [Methylococcales symbiont of Hymedesmia sp. n. MRB-2018]|nr:MAG: CbtB-domain containing protein [Methylococcales symbiont of Hymedesmia sp. n. MRB-2018]KAF3984342.1 MAG: CbtB-domain containing protein [Methylococcales symbiont of Hymedesmia sp. n. MRB-2018]
MSQTSSAIHHSRKASLLSKHCQIVASAMVGFAILMVVGFSPIEVIHNAAHDTRHSTGFPCH